MSEAPGDHIAGAPAAMMSYTAEGPDVVDPKAEIAPVMEESIAFNNADRVAVPKLLTFGTAANQGFTQYTGTANVSGQDYLGADQTGADAFINIGNPVPGV